MGDLMLELWDEFKLVWDSDSTGERAETFELFFDPTGEKEVLLGGDDTDPDPKDNRAAEVIEVFGDGTGDKEILWGDATDFDATGDHAVAGLLPSFVGTGNFFVFSASTSNLRGCFLPDVLSAALRLFFSAIVVFFGFFVSWSNDPRKILQPIKWAHKSVAGHEHFNAEYVLGMSVTILFSL